MKILYSTGQMIPFIPSREKNEMQALKDQIKDKTFVAFKLGDELGKARITEYYIKFKTVKNIYLELLNGAFHSGQETKNQILY